MSTKRKPVHVWLSQKGIICCRRRSGSHPDLRSLGSLQSSPSGSGHLYAAGHVRRRSSEDDVFGAAGGLEMSSDPSEAATARNVGMAESSSAGSLPHVESRGSIASGIGDLPPGDPPSRTLLIRNIQPSISDEALRATFAVSRLCDAYGTGSTFWSCTAWRVKLETFRNAVCLCRKEHVQTLACTSESTWPYCSGWQGPAERGVNPRLLGVA